MENFPSPYYVDCDGFKIAPAYSPDTFRSALNYVHKPGQMFLASYPKTGSTWLEHIILLILRGGQPIKDEEDALLSAPILEATGARGVDIMRQPGIIKFHLPFNVVHTCPQAKYMYIARNPKDCCVAFYYHTKKVPYYNFRDGTFEQFLELFINRGTNYGDYFDNLLSWYEHKDDPNVHFVTFENLKNDTKGEILRLAKFIGDEYYRTLQTDCEFMENVLHYSSFDYMKGKVNDIMDALLENTASDLKTASTLLPGIKYFMEQKIKLAGIRKDASDIKFIRKGIIGDWKNHFNAEQEERMDNWIKRRTEGSDVMDLWKDIIN